MTTPAPPTLTSIICRTAAPRAILDFSWMPNGDYTGPFTIVVQDASGKVVGRTGGQAFGGSWSAPIDMDVNATFFAIVQTGDPNIATAATLVLVTKFIGLVTNFDGKRLVMTWSDPTGPRPERAQPGARARVVVQTFATIENVRAASVEPSPFILPPAEPWWGQVAPVTGIATGPVSTPATLLKTTPAVSALSCALPGAGGVEVDLITPNDASYTSAPSFAVTLYADDWPLESRPAVVAAKQPDGSWRIPYPISTPWPLPGGANYRFGLRQTTATATGPEGPRLQLPATAPVVESLAYQPASGTDTADTLKLVLRAPPGVPYATGARITLLDAAKVPQASVLLSGFSGSVQVPKLSGTAYSMAVATTIGPAVGLPGTDTVDLLLAAPALSTAHYDQNQLHATWTAPASGSPSTYLLTVKSQGAVVASSQFGGTSGRLNVPSGTLTVEVNALTARAAGPASPSLTLIVDVPVVADLAFNADQSASVTLAAGPPANRIRYEVVNDSQTLKADTLPAGTTAIPVAAALLRPDQVPTIRVRYLSAGAAPEAAGPWSVPVPLLAKAPGTVSARYDGATVDLLWEAVASSLVTGYQVQFLADGQPAGDPLTTSDTRLTVAQRLDRGKRNTVVVRAVAGQWPGLPAAAADLFEAGFYFSTNPAQAPHLTPANAMNLAPYDITLQLPDLFASRPADLPDTGAFKMSVGNGSPYAYVLTMPKVVASGQGVWDFNADPVRTGLRESYNGLIAGLVLRGATAAGLHTLRAAIGRAMPQTFTETLLYGGSLDAAVGVVDLQPGIVLRVDYEDYQYLGTANPYASYLNGYVGAGVLIYETSSAVDANGRWLLGFDAFLAQIVQSMHIAAPTKNQGKQAGAGGIADTFYSNFRQPFVRIVYPADFIGSDEAGTPFPSYNLALLAAPTIDLLNAATADLRAHRDQIDTAAVLYFRGRAMLTPCVRIWVDGESRIVPLGTTVGNVLESLGQRPPPLGLALAGLRFTRMNGPAITGTAARYAFDQGMPVRFDWDQNIAYSPNVDWFSLPVLAGDRLWTRG